MRFIMTAICILCAPVVLFALWVVGKQEGIPLRQMVREYREDFTL